MVMGTRCAWDTKTQEPTQEVGSQSGNSFCCYGIRNGRNGFSGVVRTNLERLRRSEGVSFAQTKKFHSTQEAEKWVQAGQPQGGEQKQWCYGIRGGAGGYRGVVHTWTECKALVHSVKGSKYKKFSKRSEAEKFARAQ